MKISEAAKKAAEEIDRGVRVYHLNQRDVVVEKIQYAIDSETRELREALKLMVSEFGKSKCDLKEPGYGQRLAALSIAKDALSKAGAEDALKTRTGGGDETKNNVS